MALTHGMRLGAYEILALVGAGGMAEVYRARDTRLDRTVAIKVLHASFASSPQRRERFEREARAIYVEPVLLGERVDHAAAAAACPADAPGPRLDRQRILRVDGLVRAVEGAQAEVDDADLQVPRVHAGRRDLARRPEAQPHGSAQAGAPRPKPAA